MAASDYGVHEPFPQLREPHLACATALDRRALDRGAGVRPAFRTYCSPTSRTTASCATTRPTTRCRRSAPRRPHQRPHRRPAGTPRHLRARRTTRLRTEHDGTITVIADSYQGKAQLAERRGGEVRRLDLVHRSALRHPLRLRGPQGRAGERQQRLSRRPGRHIASSPTTSSAQRPRLLARREELYIVDIGGGRTKGQPKHIRVFDVREDGTLCGGAEFADCTAGRFDGMRFDTDGRLWIGSDDGVHCVDTDGTLSAR